MCDRFQSIADEQGLDAIVISPSFDKADPPAQAHPILGGIHGRLLVSPLGEIKDPKSFLLSPENAKNVTKSVQYIFNSRIANVAGTPAKPDAQRIPFLVMCGSLDERFENAQLFARSHDEASRKEFDKYSRGAMNFFLRMTQKKDA